jgi:hypothetical protein
VRDDDVKGGDEPRAPAATSVAVPVRAAAVALATGLHQIDDATALEMRRLVWLWERRLQRPIKLLLVFHLFVGCPGMVVVGAGTGAVVGTAIGTVLFLAGLVAVPATVGLLREEARQQGITTGLLRALCRIPPSAGTEGRDWEARFVVELARARERDRQLREQPTVARRLRRLLLGP